MSGTAMLLEASTTNHTADAATGVEIKSGDATRTLVGLARTGGTPSWVDTPAERYVLSYFNRGTITGRRNFTADRATTSGVYGELSTEMRANFLTWGDEVVVANITGSASQTTDNPVVTALQLDGATNEDGYNYSSFAAPNLTASVSVTQMKLLSEGFHFYTLAGKVVNSGTGVWKGGAANSTDVTVLQVMIRG